MNRQKMIITDALMRSAYPGIVLSSLQADIYSLGIILFELFCPFITEMERVTCIKELRQGNLPEDFKTTWRKQVCIKTLPQGTIPFMTTACGLPLACKGKN